MRVRFCHARSAPLWGIAAVCVYFAASFTIDPPAGRAKNIVENLLLNSDALYLFLFARDILTGVSIAGWTTPPAPAFFPDLLFVFPAVTLTLAAEWEPAAAVILAAWLQGMAWILSCAWFFRVLGDELSPEAPGARRHLAMGAPLGGALIFAWIAVGGEGGVMALAMVPGFHAGVFLMLPICMGLTLRIFGSHRDADALDAAKSGGAARPGGVLEFVGTGPAWRLALLALIVCLSCVSDGSVLPGVILPLALCLPVLGLPAGRDRVLRFPFGLNRRGNGLVLWYLAALGTGMLLSGPVGDWLNRKVVVMRLQPDWSRLFSAEFSRELLRALEILPGALGFGTGLALFVSLGVLAALAWRMRSAAAPRARRIVWWWLALVTLSLCAMCAAMLVVGYVVSGYSSVLRYLAPALIFPPMSAAFGILLMRQLFKKQLREQQLPGQQNGAADPAPSRWADVVGGESPRRWPGAVMRYAPALLMAAALIALALALAYLRASSACPARDPASRLTRCLLRNRALVGRSGLSGYWIAKPVTFLSDGRLLVNQLEENLQPKLWVNNANWFYAPHEAPAASAAGQAPGYSFIILEGLSRALILKRFGAPARRLDCAGFEVFVYDRPGDRAFRELYPPAFLDFVLSSIGRSR